MVGQEEGFHTAWRGAPWEDVSGCPVLHLCRWTDATMQRVSVQTETAVHAPDCK